MKRYQLSLTLCAVACGIAWGIPTIGFAQATPPQTPAHAPPAQAGGITTAAEVGIRNFLKEPSALDKGKFEQYTSTQAGPVLERLKIGYVPKDSFGIYQFTYRRPSDRDQSAWLQAKRPGAYDFQLHWERLQHTFSTDAHSPGVENSPMGFNTLPTPRPDSTAWRNAPYIGAIRTVWEPMKMSLGLTPSVDADFLAEYLRTTKLGGIPSSMSFNGSSGPQREFVSPINQTTSEFRIAHSFTSRELTHPEGYSPIKNYQFTGAYEYSRFQNALTSVMVDNPMQAVNSSTLGAATSRLSLAPNNSAHSASFVGAVTLPLRTRFTGSVATSWQYQNDAFLPQTNNDSLKTLATYSTVATLARPSLDGKVVTSTLNFALSSHPFAGLTLAARYRSYDYKNETAMFHIKAMVVSDRSIALADSLYTEASPFSKQNSDISATYDIAQGLAMQLGMGTENWTRELDVRGVGSTKEQTPRVSFDYRGFDWGTLHASYSKGERRSDRYIESGTELITFRRFDTADRSREQLNLMASITPIDQVTLGLSYTTGSDLFPNSLYGTQSDKSVTTGVDLDWTPTKRLSISLGYSDEAVDNILNMRYRTGTATSVTYDNYTYRWTNTNTDRTTVVSAGLIAAVIPDRVDFSATVSRIDGRFWVLNSNPNSPAGGTIAQNLAAVAQDWPEVTQSLTPVTMALRLRLSDNWGVTLKYQAENYTQNDFRTLAPIFTSTTLAGLTPNVNFTGNLPGNVGATTGTNTGQYHFLGNNYNPYQANWLTFTISWHPSALPLDVGRPAF